MLDDLVPGAVSRGATIGTAAAGVGLLLLAGGLRRRQRLAWLAAVGLLLASAVLHVIKGLDVEEALAEAFIGGLLAGMGAQFRARPGPGSGRGLLVSALVVMAVTVGYGVVGLLVNNRDVVEDLSVMTTLGEVTRMAVGAGTRLTVTGRFGRFFPGSVAAVFYLGALVGAARALAPALVPRVVDPGLGTAVADSQDSLAYFALRDDRATVRAGEALISYRPVGTVALAAGDPLGPPNQWPAAVATFVEEAARQGRIGAVLGCGGTAAGVCAAAGLTTIYLGDEAVLELDRFTLEGRAVRIARQSWNRARRAGYTSLMGRSGDLDTGSVNTLRALSRRWRGTAAERGFSMALGRLFDPRDHATMVVAARDGQGRLRGFLHFVPWGQDGASLDVMRRDRQAPGWLNDFLIVEAARRLPELGIRHLSLNFS
ncbi:MAG TPA: phosphatidylglycerol lysyltransferase domain-containing protein, partial [Actinomycetota bacterium]